MHVGEIMTLDNGVPIAAHWSTTCPYVAGMKVVSSSGVAPGGIGIVEGGLVATFIAYGIKGSAAAAALAARTHALDRATSPDIRFDS